MPLSNISVGISLQAGNWNPGDGISTYSGRELLSSAFQRASIDTWFMFESKPLAYDGFDFLEYDFSVVMCTPWLWDQAASSRKYNILRTFNNSIASKKRIALGVGASFLLHHRGADESYPGQASAIECSADWQSFDLIICRDRLALRLYKEIVPEERVMLLPCPSYYVAEHFGIDASKSGSHLLVFADVASDNYWGVQEKDIKVTNDHQEAMILAGYPVMTMFDRDYRVFKQRYGREPDANLRSPREIVTEIARHGALTSPRVHACMPALSLGLTTNILALDSRALTAIGLGATSVGPALYEMEAFCERIDAIDREQFVSSISSRL